MSNKHKESERIASTHEREFGVGFDRKVGGRVTGKHADQIDVRLALSVSLQHTDRKLEHVR
jgi:hypothetical protein